MQLRATLCHYSWVIRQYSPVIGLVVLVCTCATSGISLCFPPVYQATALIMVSSSVDVGETTSNDIYSNQALAFSYSFLVTQNDVLQVAAQQLPGFSVSQLAQAVSDSPIANTPMIEVRAQAANPRQAALIANVVARAFVRVRLHKVSSDLQDQEKQLSLRLQAARVASDAAQAKLLLLQAHHASASAIAAQRSLSDADQADYSALLEHYHSLLSLELQVPSTLDVSQLATPPAQPIGPHIWLNAAVAAALSLLLAVVGVLLKDWMDESIKTEEDVVYLTSLRALGSVPCYTPPALPDDTVVKSGQSEQSGQSGQPEQSSSILRSEAIDSSLMAISSALLGQCAGKRAIMLTSLRSACGTSTVAANLALALTRAGKRVLLIDANLRRPRLHLGGFQFFHSQSLVNCLAALRLYPQSRSCIDSWLDQWRTCTPYLWLLPAGPVPLHPSALLALPEVALLIQSLLTCQAIDLLILDCAALDNGADALALAVAVDATVLVIEAGKEKKEDLNRASRSLERLNAPVLGVIVNRWHSGLRSYFYADRTQAEYEALAARLQEPSFITQWSLPETQRLPVYAQQPGPTRLSERLMAIETPPPLVRVAPSSLMAATTTLSRKAIAYGASQAKALHTVSARHKGIIIPARPYDLPEDSRGRSLRSYDARSRGK
jgi:capsular exopolysaccharide synthesis family protein